MSDNYRPFGPGSFPGASAPADADTVSVNVRADPALRSKPFSFAKIRSTLVEFFSQRIVQPFVGGAIRILENVTKTEWYDASTQCTLTILNNDPANYQKAGIYVESRQDTSAGTIGVTGIRSVSYTQPDNGGDTSAFLGLSTGGGPAATFYRNCNARPSGSADYSTSIAPTLEVGTTAGSYAVLAAAGVQVFGGTIKRSTAVLARIDSATSDGIGVQPQDNVFNARYGFYVGTHQIDSSPINLKSWIKLDGTAFFKDVKVQDTKFVGLVPVVAPPTTTELPDAGDFGFFYDSVGGNFYLAFNLVGVIKKVTLT